jgi:hypothetical protein
MQKFGAGECCMKRESEQINNRTKIYHAVVMKSPAASASSQPQVFPTPAPDRGVFVAVTVSEPLRAILKPTSNAKRVPRAVCQYPWVTLLVIAKLLNSLGQGWGQAIKTTGTRV